MLEFIYSNSYEVWIIYETISGCVFYLNSLENVTPICRQPEDVNILVKRID